MRIRHLLTHTSGLPAPTVKVPDEALYDWAAMIDALERSTLWWEPGTRCGYHAATFGWLNGELVRRISGQSVGQYLREHIAGPIGADVAIGLTESEQARTVETLAPAAAVNTRRWREAEIPSSNGHASARGLARLYTPLALGGAWNGVRVLSEAGVELAAREQIHMKDVVTGMDTRRTLGYMLPDSRMGDPRPLTAFGHPGMGGSLGFADPAHRLAFGYVMNQMIIGSDSRAMSLSRAVYRCLNR